MNFFSYKVKSRRIRVSKSLESNFFLLHIYNVAVETFFTTILIFLMSPPCLTFSSPSLIPSHSAEAWADKKVSLLSEGSRTLYPGLSTKSPVSCLMPRYVLTDPGPFHTPSATCSYKRCVMCVSLFTIKEESKQKCSHRN